MVAAQQVVGRPKMGEEKLIIRSEKVRFIDILSMLLLRRPISDYRFVDVGDQTAADFASVRGDWIIALTELIQRALAVAYYPAIYIGAFVEFLLNFIVLNNGIFGIIWNIFRLKLVIPHREASNFRSMIGLIDGRTELKPVAVQSSTDEEDLESGSAAVPLIQQQNLKDNFTIMEVTMMAAKIAYENAAYIENVVNNVWKMKFVGFYSCWNKFVNDHATQAFVFTNTPTDAAAVVVAFRGTEPFNMRDWSTDVNLSWLGMGAMGHVHVGFLKALGLQEEDGKDAARAFPKITPNAAAAVDKPIAYYKLRDVIREQLKKHPRAKVIITGHSLGGALAAIFPALLVLHGETDILSRLSGVDTYGQPRVGDATLAAFLRAAGVKVRRVVYRYDVVPRVPFAGAQHVADFVHGGSCVYYDGWYAGRTIAAGDVPNPNYFDPRYLLSMYGNAWGDLFKGAVLWTKEGKDYREGLVSLLFRGAGLFVPGIASHSPRDYVNSVRLGKIAPKET